MCLESLNIFVSKTIKELFGLFPFVSFSQEHLWLHRTLQWAVEAMLLKTNQMFNSEAGEPEASFASPSFLTLS